MNRVAVDLVCPETGAPFPPGRSPDDGEAGIDARWWRWGRPLGGALVLAALMVVLGTGPFLVALRATDTRTLTAGCLVALLTTVCAAWRWRLVAHRLGADLTLPGAVASCYRAQFLNATLPGGVLGDVGRGVQHGRVGGDVGRGLRGVAWERAAGQAVLVTLTAVALLLARPLDIPGLGHAPAALLGSVLLVVAAAVLGRTRLGEGRVAGWLHLAAADLRALRGGPAPAGILVASLLVVAGHLATFVLAARTVGVRTSLAELVPLALVVLVLSAVPLNLAGWGPREGAAAWVFAAAGLGAAPGLSTAVAFGAIAFVGTLPGAALLVAGRARERWSGWSTPSAPAPAPAVGPATAGAVGGGSGG